MFSRFWQEFFKNEDFANFSALCLQDFTFHARFLSA